MKKLIILSIVLTGQALANTSFYYYSKTERLKALTELYQATKGRYALWDLKLINMEIAGDDVFKKALQIEKSIDNVQGPMQKATANLEFLDRLKKVIAEFKDTHFSLRPLAPTPVITNGLKLKSYLEEGTRKIIISAVSKKLMSLNETLTNRDYFEKFKIGDELISVDNISARNYLSNMREFVSASSGTFRDIRAAESITRRNFSYPAKNYSDWKFKRTTEEGIKTYKVRLPWYADKVSRRDANVYFKANNFHQLEKTYYSWNDELQEWNEDKDLNYIGFDRFAAPKGLTEVEEWIDSDDEVIFRSGKFLKDEKEYGYIQFFAFTNKDLTKKDANEDKDSEELEIKHLFRKFVIKLKKENIPLIVDLRLNFGGNTQIALENLSAIAKSGDSYPSRTVAYKTTPFIQSLFNTMTDDFSLLEYPEYGDLELIANEIYHAVSINKEYTNLILQSDPITAHDDVKGYELPVVALVTPYCISACDNQAFLFKASERVTLIGDHANGTGAGFWGNNFHDPSFVDSQFIFQTRIPNYLFGYPVKTEDRVIVDSDMGMLIQTNSENRPVEAHILFRDTSKTFTDQASNWIEKAITTINSI